MFHEMFEDRLLGSKSFLGYQQAYHGGVHNCTPLRALTSFNTLTPMSDQDRISPYNINTMSTRYVMRIKKNIILGMIS